jgi:protein O-mannosyl-transferase
LYTSTATDAAPRRLLIGAAALIALMLTVAIYAAGLHGPYLLDDIGNLEPLKRWVDGQLGWQGVVFGNHSGPGGRPLSMLTFLANAWFDHTLNTFAFKATNLGIHLGCGLLAFVLARLILLRAGLGRMPAALLAGFTAIAWLWLPMQASTVLYIIQRMAQLAVLLMFATLALFMVARPRIETGSRLAMLALWVGVPALALLAAAAKETGVLAIPLAAALEFTLFDRRTRPWHVKLFFALTVALPLVLAAAFVARRPDWIMGGYAARDFDLPQRLMTEPRILWSYLQASFFPVGPRMGLFHDNVPISTGLWTPASTAVALLAWMVVLLMAWMVRRRAPLFTLGVAGFLICHAIEAGPIGLELYFDHRNYGAVFFALLAVVGFIRWVVGASAAKPRVRRALFACACGCLAIYGLGAWSQAQGWSDETTFYAVQYNYNPTSPRLLSNLTGRAMMAHDLGGALHYIDEGERYSPPAEQATSTIWRLLAYCEVNEKPAPEALYEEFAARAKGRITNYAMTGWELLTQRLAAGCNSIDAARVATTASTWLATTPQSASEQPVWRTRYNTAHILADMNRVDDARAMTRKAWLDSDHNNGIGILLFQLDASLGDVAGCKEVLAALQKSEGGPDHRLDEAIDTFRKALQDGEIGSATP